MELTTVQQPNYLIDAIRQATASQVLANHPAGVAAMPLADLMVAIKCHAVIAEAPAVRHRVVNALHQQRGESALQFVARICDKSVDCEWMVECRADCEARGWREAHLHDYSGKALEFVYYFFSELSHFL